MKNNWKDDYINGGTLKLDVPWIKMGFFLIPYSLATGSLGGYLGFTIAKDIDARW